MKKITFMVLVIILVSVSLGTVVYADFGPHGVTGDKLVGFGDLGSYTIPSVKKEVALSGCYFTNTDCINSIDIIEVAVIRGDGTVMYEGPFLQVNPDGTRTIVDEPMQPHEIWSLPLGNYIYDGAGDITNPNSWLDVFGAMELPKHSYTIEIAWKPTDKKASVCPLVGVWNTWIWTYDTNTGAQTGDIRYQSNMENVKQEKN